MGAEQQRGPVRPRVVQYGTATQYAEYVGVRARVSSGEPMTPADRVVLARHEYPQFHHFPEDPKKADYYYFNEQGEVIPTPEKLTAIARNMLTSFYEPKIARLPMPESPRILSVVLAGEQAGPRLIIEEAKRIAREEYGVTGDILEIDRTPEKERERLRQLRDLRVAERTEERDALLARIKAEELDAVSRVGSDTQSYGGILIITETNPKVIQGFDAEDVQALTDARDAARGMRGRHERNWMLSSYPHEETVQVDKRMNPGRDVTLEEEVFEWLQACERPLQEVLLAQEKLKGIMDRARQVRVVANAGKEGWETDVTFGTVKESPSGELVPRRWYNHAGYENNFPGSEVFGAPHKYKGDGTIAYPYPVMFDGVLLPNLKVVVKDGQVQSWEIQGEGPEADLAREKFASRMNEEGKPGNRYFGEIGIGTSPFPTFNTADIGFNEKRTGVHFALGRCYTDNMTDEAGHPVDLDNGNEPFASIHADLVLPSSDQNPVDMWVDVGTAGKPEWVLVLHNGAFVEQAGDGQYKADAAMQILSAPDAFKEFAGGFAYAFADSESGFIRRGRGQEEQLS